MRVVSRLNQPMSANSPHHDVNDTRNLDLSGNQINLILESLVMSGIVVAYRLYKIELRDVPENLLVSLVQSCRELSICQTNLSTSQLSAIFQSIQRSENLEELELKERNLKYIPVQQKAASIASLKRVLLDDCSDNTDLEEENENFSEILLQGEPIA